MKTKRCTNSSCRKVFRVESHRCPHCGKRYPRVSPAKSDRFMVVLTYWGYGKLAVIKAIRPFTGLGLKDAKTLTDNCPSLVQTGITLHQAETLKTAIREAGGGAMIIPVSRGTRGIFVLPKKAG